ncbi:MAG: hypothetical protein ACFFA7_00925 [Promethearchaeota archaeon]
MLHKSKINLSLILLIIGLGLIPTGFFVKEYLRDNADSQVAPFLIDLEDKVDDYILANYLGLGIYNVLPAIHDQHITEIRQNFALVFGIPSTLLYLKNITLEKLPGFINASRAASAIVNTITTIRTDNVTTVPTSEIARDLFFNNYTFQDDFHTSIEGVSERMLGGTESLNYSALAADYLLNGRDYMGTSYPGIREDLTYGTSQLEWLEFYYSAEADIGTNRSLMETVYDCNWSSGQLQNLSAYITTYLWDVIVKNDYTPSDIETYSEEVFYDQWANGTWVSTGFNLMYFSEYITSSITGLEVGRTTPTNINYTSAINLWDPSNSSSFVNDKGIIKWFAARNGNTTIANELKTAFKLKSTSMTRLYTWLFTVVRGSLVGLIYPLPAPIGIGMSIAEYSDILYAEQWANGTYIPQGIDLIGTTVLIFEIGVPIKSNISLESAVALLDPTNTSSFIDRDGIIKWIDAYEGDTTAQTELMTIFKLDLDQLTLINNWLFNTIRYALVPALAYRYTTVRMVTYARFEFYRQWANGALYEDGLDIGAFEGLASINGWEIGIPTATNIDEFTGYMLWDQTEDYSIVNWKGLSLWFKAISDQQTRDYLQEYYDTTTDLISGVYYDINLSVSQVDEILNWIVYIRDNFVLYNIENVANLPIDILTLGNNIFFMFTIAGGVIGAIGALGIVVLLITKRK